MFKVSRPYVQATPEAICCHYGYVFSGLRKGAVLGRGFAKTPQFCAHALE